MGMKMNILVIQISLLIVSCSINKNAVMKTEKTTIQMPSGEKVKGRKMIIETKLNTSANLVWEEVVKPSFWIDILDPKAVLKPLDSLPVGWEMDKSYTFWLRMYKIIPFGKHHIDFETIDSLNYKLQTREYGFMVPHWDNLVEVEALTDSTCILRDVLFVSAKGIESVVMAYAKDVFKKKHKRLQKIF